MQVTEEVERNILYIKMLYQAYSKLHRYIIEQATLAYPQITSEDKKNISSMISKAFKLRSWVAGDADGNINVTSNTMLHALEKQSNFLYFSIYRAY